MNRALYLHRTQNSMDINTFEQRVVGITTIELCS